MIPWTLSVANWGPDQAVEIRLRDTMPSGVVIVSVESADMACAHTETVIDCTRGTLAEGAAVVVDVMTRTRFDPDSVGDLTANLAEVDADTPDVDRTNNVASAPIEFVVVLDPSIADLENSELPETGPGRNHLPLAVAGAILIGLGTALVVMARSGRRT